VRDREQQRDRIQDETTTAHRCKHPLVRPRSAIVLRRYRLATRIPPKIPRPGRSKPVGF
jgi:hypothetical protein